MPLYKITKSDFSRIDWRAVREHVHFQLDTIETELWLFSRSSLSAWRFSMVLHNDRTIACQFWIDSDIYYRKNSIDRRSRREPRKVVDNPRRFQNLTRGEYSILFDLLKSIRSKPWINLKPVWIKDQSQDGLITIHFKVSDYEPFLLD